MSYLPLLASLGIGAGAGAAVGLVIARSKGAAIGALAGGISSVIAAYLLAGIYPASDAMRATVVVLAALGCGLMAGFFFAFSTVVMSALAQQPPPAGMAAMQAINVVVFNPWFGVAFVGTPAFCVLAMILALIHWNEPGSLGLFVGGGLYLLGTLTVTALCNVPRNEALDALGPTAPGAGPFWSRYLIEWTAWNHVRTAAAFAAAAAFIIARA